MIASTVPSPRELILVARHDAGLRVLESLIAAADVQPLERLKDILLTEHATLTPLFGGSDDLFAEHLSGASGLLSESELNPSLFFQVGAPDETLERIAERLAGLDLVETAYVKPGAEPPIFDTEMVEPFEVTTAFPLNLLPSCNFTNDQEYVTAGEHGINVPAALAIKGGDGDGVNVIDIEGAWCFSHSDLISEQQGGMIGGVPIDDDLWRNHGTAVLGVLGGDRNGFGITGICPRAYLRTMSIFGWPPPSTAPTWGSAAAIRLAADALNPGDVLVLELHFPGPPAFKPSKAQTGYIPAEWWPDCQTAIRYATEVRNVTVVAAAGNGGVSLDSKIYDMDPDSPNGPFPAAWMNSLSRKHIDTGSIFVGAGAPRRGIHNDELGPVRSRLQFSNYGSMVDAQAWGADVTTTGFGKLCRVEENFFYTRKFNGTSSATAIVAGAVACLQGIRKAAKQPPLTSKQVRQILQETGSKQTDFPGAPAPPTRPATERIGNLPDLKQMIDKLAEF